MRSIAQRFGFGLALLTLGVIGLVTPQTRTVSATESNEADLKALLTADAGNISKIVDAGKFAARDIKALKSNAIMIATYTNANIKGNGDMDKKLAALRDASLQIAEFANNGKADFPKIKDVAKTLTMDIKPAAEAKKMTHADMMKAAKFDPKKSPFDVDLLMYQFRKSTTMGLNTEDDLEKNSAKLTADQLKSIAVRLQYTADLQNDVKPDFGGKKTEKEWNNFNGGMRKGAEELYAAAGDAKKTKAAVEKINAACVGCHNVFK